MIAVRKHDEREGASPAGHANMSIERYVRVEKWPRSASPEVGERRLIDAARDVHRIRRIVDHILGQRCRVGERRRAVDEGVELHVTSDGRVFQTCHFRSWRVCASTYTRAAELIISFALMRNRTRPRAQ